MKNDLNYRLFVSCLAIILLVMISFIGVEHNKVSTENDILRHRVDSLKVEVTNLNVSLDESTGIAMSLAERMSRLYEIDKETHRKLFSETD